MKLWYRTKSCNPNDQFQYRHRYFKCWQSMIRWLGVYVPVTSGGGKQYLKRSDRKISGSGHIMWNQNLYKLKCKE